MAKRFTKGQSFVEFMFLLLVIIGLSFGMIAGFNGKIAERWTEIIKIVTADDLNGPNPKDITPR